MVQHLEDHSLFTSVVLFVVAFILTLYSVFFSLFSTANFEACSFLVSRILDVFLEASCCYCQLSWKFSAVVVGRLGSFSIFLSVILQAKTARRIAY